jgi:pyruvate/2-oxoglutarate dehydrogenase complex dihydrolipoamide dehydrogenase (E3) component
VRRFGGEVTIVDGGDRVLAREPAALGEALGKVLQAEGIEIVLGVKATGAGRDGDEFTLALDDGRELQETACSSRLGVGRASGTSGSRRSVSRRARAASRSMRISESPRRRGPSATSPASGT